jgi:phage-related protein
MPAGFKIADGFIEIVGEVDHGDLQRRVQAAVASISRAARTVELLTDVDASRIAAAVNGAVGRIPRAARTVQLLVDFDPLVIATAVNGAVGRIPRAARTIQLLVDIDPSDLAAKIAAAIRLIPPALRTITLNVNIDLGAALAQLLLLRGLLSGLGGSGPGSVGGFGASFGGLQGPIGWVTSSVSAVLVPLSALFAGLTLLPSITGLAVAAVGGLSTAAFGLTGVAAALALGLQGGLLPALKDMVTTGKVASDALAKLTPSARAFVVALTPVHGLLERIGRLAQERLFAGLAPILSGMINRLGVLDPFIGRIADGLNAIARGVLAAFGAPRNIEMVASIFTAMGDALRIVSGVIPNLVNAFLRIGESAIPVMTKLAEKVLQLSEWFQAWIVGLDDAGRLDGVFMDAMKEAKGLLDVLGGLIIVTGKFLGVLFPGVAEGQATMSGLVAKLDEISAWLDNPENAERIRQWVESFMVWGKAGLDAAGTIINALDSIIGVTQTVLGWLGNIPGAIGGFIEAIEGFFGRVAAWFGSVVGAVTMVVAAVPGFIAGVAATVGGFVASIDAFVTALPGQIAAGVAALPGVLAAGVVAVFDAVTYSVGFAVGMVAAHVIALPGRISAAISAIPGIVSGVFNAARDSMVNIAVAAVDSTTGFFSTLPGRAGAAVSGLWGAISGAFFGAKDQATGQASNTVNSVAGTLASLPDRARGALGGFAGAVAGALSSAVGSAYGIGQDIVRGVANGISSATGFVTDAARRAAANAVAGFKAALGIGSPSKVMASEVGRWIPAGIGSGIEAAMPALQHVVRTAVADIVAPMAAAAQAPVFGLRDAAFELAAHLWGTGGRLFEDLSFQGMSAEYAKWLSGTTNGVKNRRLLVPEYGSSAVSKWLSPWQGTGKMWWDSGALGGRMQDILRSTTPMPLAPPLPSAPTSGPPAVYQTFNVAMTVDVSAIDDFAKIVRMMNSIPAVARTMAGPSRSRL